MTYRFQTLFVPIPLSLLLIASCGGGGSDSPDASSGTPDSGVQYDAGPTPDATQAPDAGSAFCMEFDSPVTTLATYPASYAGNLVGAGADLSVAGGVCTDERSYWNQDGEDLIVQLDGLTAGDGYQVTITSAGDVNFYVTSGCSSATLEGDCLLFVDQFFEIGDPETGEFLAPANGTAFVVVDHWVATVGDPLADGTFTLDVTKPECTVDAACAGTPATPFCSDEFVCVACRASVHCDMEAAPVCDAATNMCVAGYDECTGDDGMPPENADDGPVGATALAPAEGVPAVVSAKICSAPTGESDHYSFTALAGDTRVLTLDWPGAGDDLDFVLQDATGAVVASSASANNPEVIVATDLAAGDYYVVVTKADAAPVAAAVDYTLTVALPECETSFDCANAAMPVCGPILECVAGYDDCVGDDAAENGDDGPAGATVLTTGVAVNASICSTPAAERDYFKVTLADTADLAVSVSFPAEDLDVQVVDSTGTPMGLTFYQNPETINLTYLPAGDYYVVVQNFNGATTAAYSITATVTDNGDCANATDCAAEFSTQIYRGSCDVVTGACSAIDGAGALAQGTACDSPDDCTSNYCSNLLFQEGAGASVCTITCNADADCAGLGAFSCTVPFATNTCHPTCAGDLECGANVGSANLNAGQPWDYLTCTAGACDVDP